MAAYMFFDVNTWQDVRVTSATKATLLLAIEKAEKKNFPTSEAFDFTIELMKRNTELLVCTDSENLVVAYAVFNRLGKTALLHKILVREPYRRQGIARKVLKGHIERLSRQGCRNVQLWVDETREPARELYRRLGFEEMGYVKDYYALGRSGIKMKLSI